MARRDSSDSSEAVEDNADSSLPNTSPWHGKLPKNCLAENSRNLSSGRYGMFNRLRTPVAKPKKARDEESPSKPTARKRSFGMFERASQEHQGSPTADDSDDDGLFFRESRGEAHTQPVDSDVDSETEDSVLQADAYLYEGITKPQASQVRRYLDLKGGIEDGKASILAIRAEIDDRAARIGDLEKTLGETDRKKRVRLSKEQLESQKEAQKERRTLKAKNLAEMARLASKEMEVGQLKSAIEVMERTGRFALGRLVGIVEERKSKKPSGNDKMTQTSM